MADGGGKKRGPARKFSTPERRKRHASRQKKSRRESVQLGDTYSRWETIRTRLNIQDDVTFAEHLLDVLESSRASSTPVVGGIAAPSLSDVSSILGTPPSQMQVFQSESPLELSSNSFSNFFEPALEDDFDVPIVDDLKDPDYEPLEDAFDLTFVDPDVDEQMPPISIEEVVFDVDHVTDAPDDLEEADAVPQEDSCMVTGCPLKPLLKTKTAGTAVYFVWECDEKHVSTRWCSQPALKPKRMPVGNIVLPSAVTLSGNNYSKMATMFKMARLGFVSVRTFSRLQTHSTCQAIDDYWEKMRQEKLCTLKMNPEPMVIACDGRMDSPGFCAQYCTYTAMKEKTQAIVDIVITDKRETALNSPAMELHSMKKMMDEPQRDGVEVKEVITDAHSSITKYMRTEHPKKMHSYDVWHGAKNLGKKISAAAAEKENEDLKGWTKELTNFFWTCCKECGGDAAVLRNNLVGSLHHVSGVHQWGCGRCIHDEKIGPERKPVEQGSPPHIASRRILYNEYLLRSLPHYVKFRVTYYLESFQNHILAYASKRFHFSYQAYGSRCRLAAIDYNHHLDRQPLKNKKGEIIYNRLYSKRTGRWTAHVKKEPKKFLYIDDILGDLIGRLAQGDVTLRANVTIQPDSEFLFERMGLR